MSPSSILGVSGSKLTRAQDLEENLARADKFESDFAGKIDEFIAKNGMEAPEESLPVLLDKRIFDLSQRSRLVVTAGN